MNSPSASGKGKQPGELNKAIYDKVLIHPGISRDALIRHAQQACPDATEKQIGKTISNLVHSSKKILMEGESGNLSYHLNTAALLPKSKPAKKTPAKKAPAAKLLTGEAGRDEARKLAPARMASKMKASQSFQMTIRALRFLATGHSKSMMAIQRCCLVRIKLVACLNLWDAWR